MASPMDKLILSIVVSSKEPDSNLSEKHTMTVASS